MRQIAADRDSPPLSRSLGIPIAREDASANYGALTKCDTCMDACSRHLVFLEKVNTRRLDGSPLKTRRHLNIK